MQRDYCFWPCCNRSTLKLPRGQERVKRKRTKVYTTSSLETNLDQDSVKSSLPTVSRGARHGRHQRLDPTISLGTCYTTASIWATYLSSPPSSLERRVRRRVSASQCLVSVNDSENDSTWAPVLKHRKSNTESLSKFCLRSTLFRGC